MIPALVMGGLSLAGGLLSSKSSKKAQKEANAIARETLNFNKQRYNDYKKIGRASCRERVSSPV